MMLLRLNENSLKGILPFAIKKYKPIILKEFVMILSYDSE